MVAEVGFPCWRCRSLSPDSLGNYLASLGLFVCSAGSGRARASRGATKSCRWLAALGRLANCSTSSRGSPPAAPGLPTTGAGTRSRRRGRRRSRGCRLRCGKRQAEKRELQFFAAHAVPHARCELQPAFVVAAETPANVRSQMGGQRRQRHLRGRPRSSGSQKQAKPKSKRLLVRSARRRRSTTTTGTHRPDRSRIAMNLRPCFSGDHSRGLLRSLSQALGLARQRSSTTAVSRPPAKGRSRRGRWCSPAKDWPPSLAARLDDSALEPRVLSAPSPLLPSPSRLLLRMRQTGFEGKSGRLFGRDRCRWPK